MAFRLDLFDPLWAKGRLEFLQQMDKYHREEVEKCRAEARTLKWKLNELAKKEAQRKAYGF